MREPITETNCIICGDCEDRLADIPEESVDLIYLDPPFFSGRDYEVIWNDGTEVRSFTDTAFYTLICKCGKAFPDNQQYCAYCGESKDGATKKRANKIDAYLQWLRPKLELCHNVLKDTGSIYVHLDWHAVHYVKVMMDEIFGYDNFRNEIVWCYTGPSSPKMKQFARKHDTILLYSKGKSWIWNLEALRLPYAETSKSAFTSASKLGGERTKYLKNGGKYPEDWWTHIPSLKNTNEKLGYPTQKPEALLERIIKASSNPEDVVLDPFCGCGTAIAVAQKLDRQWVGIDVSPISCKLMVNRLQSNDVQIEESDIINLPRSLEELRVMDPFEFQNWVMHKLDGKVNPKKTGDGGIDGWTYKDSDKRMGLEGCVQVKRSDNVSYPEIQKFMGAMLGDKKTDKKHGTFVAFSFVKNVTEKLKKLYLDTGTSVELITVEQLIRGD